jgi:hypothetical protein
VPPFFLGGACISGETSITNGIFSISAPPCLLGGFYPPLTPSTCVGKSFKSCGLILTPRGRIYRSKALK